MELGEKNGAFDPKTMGACPNVRLMAQKAEVHGPHPCTFEVKMTAAGDAYRSCQTKDAPIKNWVVLAVKRCRANGFPGDDKPCKAILWPDAARPHDAILTDKVREYLPPCDTKGHDLEVLSPTEATRVTCKRAKEGLNTITVTGNVLRDYLTDLSPILVLGASAKMLSVVPGLAGGCMYAPSLCPFGCVRALRACVCGGSGVSLSLSVSASVSVSVTGSTSLGEIGRLGVAGAHGEGRALKAPLMTDGMARVLEVENVAGVQTRSQGRDQHQRVEGPACDLDALQHHPT